MVDLSMPYKDPEKQKEAQRRSHEKLRDERRRADRSRKREWYSIFREKKEVPCADCGIKYPYYVMQFDHIRGEKQGNVSRLLNNRQYKLALEEIEKCDVVCSNCHHTRTWNRTLKGEDNPRFIA